MLCDSLDQQRHRRQALDYRVRPLYPEARIIGTARTLLSKEIVIIGLSDFDTIADLQKIASYQPDDTEGIMWRNWFSFFQRAWAGGS